MSSFFCFFVLFLSLFPLWLFNFDYVCVNGHDNKDVLAF